MSTTKLFNVLTGGVVPLVSLLVPNLALASRVEVNAPLTGFLEKPLFIHLEGKDFQEINGGGLNLSFDPTKFAFSRVTFNQEQWDFHSSASTDNQDQGKVQDIAFASTFGINGNARIATVELMPLEPGLTTISLSQSSKSPFSSAGFPFSMELEAKTINITNKLPPKNAPIPGHVAGLIAAGLLFLRRRQSA